MLKKVRPFVVITITSLLLYLVFRKVGVSSFMDTLRQANFQWIGISIALEPLLILTGVIKWQILLKAQGVHVSFRRLYALYLVGRFFNNFLPSNVGGDVVRAYELGSHTKNAAAALASVFMERFTGFLTLIGIALVSFLTHSRMVGDPRLTLAMAVAVVGLLGMLWVILDPRPLELFSKWVRIPLAQKYLPKLQKFRSSIIAYKDHRRALALAMLWSLAFMILAIFNVYTSARAFHQPVSFTGIAVIVPVILVVAMMPLTFNGLGLQELAYVILFTWIGLPGPVGLSTIVLIRAKDLLVAVLGGILYPVVKLSGDRSALTSREVDAGNH